MNLRSFFLLCCVVFISISSIGCSGSLYYRSKNLSLAKMEKATAESNIEKTDGYEVSVQNNSECRRVRIVINPFTLGLRDGFDGYLEPKTTLYIRLLPGDYHAESYYNGELCKKSKILYVRSDKKVYNGVKYVHEHAEHNDR